MNNPVARNLTHYQAHVETLCPTFLKEWINYPFPLKCQGPAGIILPRDSFKVYTSNELRYKIAIPSPKPTWQMSIIRALDVVWASMCLKSSVTQMFVQQCVRENGIINDTALYNWPFVREIPYSISFKEDRQCIPLLWHHHVTTDRQIRTFDIRG